MHDRVHAVPVGGEAAELAHVAAHHLGGKTIAGIDVVGGEHEAPDAAAAAGQTLAHAHAHVARSAGQEDHGWASILGGMRLSASEKREDSDVIAADERTLRRLGYAQELLRRMSGFSNFAISLSIICILAGGMTSFHLGLLQRRAAPRSAWAGRWCACSRWRWPRRWARSRRPSHRRRALPLGRDPRRQRAGAG